MPRRWRGTEFRQKFQAENAEIFGEIREPMGRIELPTPFLPRTCSTTELHRQFTYEPRRGFEPPTFALQKRCSTVELPRQDDTRIISVNEAIFEGKSDPILKSSAAFLEKPGG